ncbi:MAG: response regulator transcription factor [Planctomycetota bacterium]|jgi:two-component system response regulator TtrR
MMTSYVEGEHSVFVVDDEPRVCEAICETLEQSGIRVSCFSNAVECIEQLHRQKCHLLITDLRMPQMDGVELATNARVIAPWLPVLMITGYGDIPTAVKAVKAGVVDFVEKPLVKEEFLKRVKSLLDERAGGYERLGSPLTRRETKVMKLIVEGKSNKEIANLLHRSVRTIEVHRGRVMNKLGVTSLIDLIKRAATMGLVDLPSERWQEETGPGPGNRR